MSLMRLLTVGQSVRGLSNEPSPYKINEQHFLPKFASVGRPVSLAPPKERLAQAVRVRSSDQAVAVDPASRAVTVAAFTPSPVAKAIQRPVSVAKEEEKGWRSLLSFFGRSKPRPRRPLVQGEMTLETLKVVRNDLSEADLEVVPVKLATPAEPAPAAKDETVANSVWSRATAQLSNVTRLWL